MDDLRKKGDWFYLASAYDMHLPSHMQTVFGAQHVRFPLNTSLGTTYRASMTYATPEQPGALYDELRVSGNCRGVFDFTGQIGSHGLTDFLRHSDAGIPVFGPGIRGVALESERSVGYAAINRAKTTLVTPHSVFYLHPPSENARRDAWATFQYRAVVKQEHGLNLFRVRFANTWHQFNHLLDTMEYPLQVQPRVSGIEVAYYVAVVGESAHIVPLCTIFEHKRALTGNLGALTAEMGTVVDASVSVPPRVLRVFEALRPELQQRRYTGLLEINTIFDPVTKTWHFMEFTCRQSDPAWSILLTMFDAHSTATVFQDWLHGIPTTPRFQHPTSVGVVVTGSGYPQPNGCIQGIPITVARDAWLFGADVVPIKVRIDGSGRWYTKGGRHVVVIGHGDSVPNARTVAYLAAPSVQFFGRYYRLDIGASWEADHAVLEANRLY